jgi:hypothetical protein
MTFADTLGWAAAALLFASFCARRRSSLHLFALASNIAFVGYGLAADLLPLQVVPLLLMPVNLWRYAQATARETQARSRGDTAAPTTTLRSGFGARRA